MTGPAKIARAYPHIKIGMFYELQLTVTFKLIKLCHLNFYVTWKYQL